MLDRAAVLTLFRETAHVFVFNLDFIPDFIPDDKLDWKPAPGAKSALEIVNHLSEYLDSVSARLGARAAAFVPAQNRDEAKAILTQSAERYLSAVRDASTEVLGHKFRDDMPLTNGWMVTASTLDTIHHAGQIAYIQTLLGDQEIHFNESALPDWAVH